MANLVNKILGFLSKKQKVIAKQRNYAGAMRTIKHADWNATSASADSIILQDLVTLRNRSRSLIRDNDYARNIKRLIQNNVIGQGVATQCTIKKANDNLNDKLNNEIESLWLDWCRADNCDVAGKLHFNDMERLIIGSLMENGEAIIRVIKQPFGKDNIPLALELIEPDRLIDQNIAISSTNPKYQIRMGVEVNEWGRPQYYYFYPNHPHDYQFKKVQTNLIKVPASEIIHLYIHERIGQTRGVPWLYSTINRLRHLGEYENAEVVGARASASLMGFIESEGKLADGLIDSQNIDEVLEFSSGQIAKLGVGEKFTGFNPSRPNTGAESFIRYMLRGMCSGVGVSYESASRDYSQSNYSSSRLALLDDRDQYKTLQSWYIRSFRQKLHEYFMDAIILSNKVSINNYFSSKKNYLSVSFKPRGWSWVDPTKEVQAATQAVQAGFMTISDVISQTSGGQDPQDVFKNHASEREELKKLNLDFSSLHFEGQNTQDEINKTAQNKPNNTEKKQEKEPDKE